MESSQTPKPKTFARLGNRLALGIAGIAMAATLVVAVMLFLTFRSQLREDFRQRLLNMVSLAALQQDGDLHARIRYQIDQQETAYRQIKRDNEGIVATDPDIAYLYTMRLDEQGRIYYVVDAGPPGARTANVLDYYDDASEELKAQFAGLDRPIVLQEYYTDEFGTFLSAYAPFYQSNGQIEGVIGMDIEATTIVQQERRFILLTLVVVLLTLPLVGGAGYLIGRQLAEPIARLSEVSRQISSGKLDLRVDLGADTYEVAELQRSFNEMASQLQSLVGGLEQGVAERTAQLSESKRQAEMRAGQLEALAEVARAIAHIQNLDLLLPAIAREISNRFGFYHVGIFLLDESRQQAVLSATNSEGGRKMLQRQHRLKVEPSSLVGYAASRQQARIALDVGSEAVFSSNPDLPETRSEAALPLLVGKEIIGVLDVQSILPNAFRPEDIQVLTTLANQVAIAIQNARLFAQTTQALSEAEKAYEQFISEGWRRQVAARPLNGYRFSGRRAEPLDRPLTTQEARSAVQRGELVIAADKRTSAGLAVPIKVSGQVIGVLNIRPQDKERRWLDEELTLITALAERVSLALENARLLNEAQRRAAKERLIGDIANKISTANSIDTILQTAILELGQAIGKSDISIQFNDTQEST